MADTYDVLSISEARTAVGLGSDTSKDTALEQHVTAISRQLDDLCGPIVNRTVTGETHDGGGPTIRLRKRPVASVTSVTEYDNLTATTLAAESNTAKTAADYLHDGVFATLDSGTLRRRDTNSDTIFEPGRRNVAVTYVAGRASNTAAVDAKFKLAASMMLRNAWVAEQASGTETFGAFADQPVNPLLGPGMLNKVAALLDGEMIDNAVAL